jgi:hypothetical protein
MGIRAIQNEYWLDAIGVYQTTQLKKEQGINIQSNKKLRQMINLDNLIMTQQTERWVASILSLPKMLLIIFIGNIKDGQDSFDMVKLI